MGGNSLWDITEGTVLTCSAGCKGLGKGWCIGMLE